MKRNLIVFFIIVCVFFSCTKEETSLIIRTSQIDDPTEEFAQILSKAVSNDIGLRFFIRDEALAQFDKDYDVFYPLEKDRLVAQGRTFRHALLDFCNESVLSEIEQRLPLLNILVPDYSWLGAFSVRDWNPEDKDISVAIKKGDKLIVYSDGVIEGELERNEFPDFPILIIKENERITYSKTTTKGGPAIKYSFVDDAFDPSLDAKTKVESIYYYDQIFSISAPDNFLFSYEVPTPVINAYNEFGGNDNRYQRDNIYFGMTNQVSTGELNTYIREYLYKFRFKTTTGGALYDATTQSDPAYADGSFPTYYYEKGDSLTLYELRNKDFRMDGNLEMRFQIIYGNGGGNGSISTNTISMSIPFSSLFEYDKVAVEYIHETWFTQKKYIYTINGNCLVPKWYIANIQLPIAAGTVWNIGNTSSIIKIKAEEFDSGETTTSTTSYSFNTSINMTTDLSSGGDFITRKNSYGVSLSQTYSSSCTYVRTNETDNLGEVLLNYLDPVILNYTSGKYEMNTYNTGYIEMMIIPRHI